MQKRVLFKRIAIGLAGLFAVLVIAAIVIPLFINIDQYRPQIVAMANERLNGKLSIGKLSLSLWGQVEVEINDTEIQDAAGNKLVAVKETYAQISFLSLLSGKPHLRFRVDHPDLNIVKDKNGKINLLAIMKEQPAGAAKTPAQTPTPAEKPAGGKSGDVPFSSLITSAGMDLELLEAKLHFVDQASNFTQDVDHFNFVVNDLSMSRPMNLRIWADIATKAGGSLSVTGPLNIVGVIKPQFEGLDFRSVQVDMDGNFDKLAIKVGEVFQKESGVLTNFKTSIEASLAKLDVKSFLFKFHNLELNATAVVNKLQEVDPEVNLKASSNTVDLASWGKLVPPLKTYELEGKMNFGANTRGALSKLEYDAKLAIKNMVAKAPGINGKPKMELAVEVITDELKELNFDLNAPGTDLTVRGNMKSFTSPRFTMTINSNSIDLDQLLPKSAAETKAAEAKEQSKDASKGDAAKSDGGKTAQKQPATDVDASLEPLRSNEMLKKLVANVAVRIKKFKGYNVNAQDIAVDFTFKDLVASVDNFVVGIWRGIIKANTSIDLKPKSPTYQLNLNIANIDLQNAVETQLSSFKNTLLGFMSVKAQGNGRSLNSDQMIKNLNLSGNLKVIEARFASIDIGAMAVEALNKGIQDIAAQIPAIKDVKLANVKNLKSKYKSIGGDFGLRGGVFLSQNFETVSYPNEGIDIKGRTEADLVNDKLDAQWSVIDTYNLTKARDVDVDVNGVKVPHIIAKDKDPVSFPVKVGCKLSAPCYDYASIPKHLSSIALDNARASVKGVAKKEVQKVTNKAKEKATKQLEKEAEKLKKRFGW